MTNIVEAIYSLYYQEPRTRRGSKPTASSGLASLCPRFAWYENNSARTSQISPLLRRRMKYGSVHEDHIRGELRQLGEAGKKETGSDNWEIKGAQMNLSLWGVKGKVDLIVRENGHWKLLEVKTMNPEDFKKFQDEGLIAFSRYYEQFMFYLEALSLMPFREPIETGILLVENTFPLGELAAEELGVDAYCIDQMEANKERLDDVLNLIEPPPRPFTRGSKECGRCWREDECWRIVQTSNSISFIDTKDPSGIKEALLKYLRAKQQSDEAETEIDEAKSYIRGAMDEAQATELSIKLEDEFYYYVTLKEVTVTEHMVKEHTSPRLTIR